MAAICSGRSSPATDGAVFCCLADLLFLLGLKGDAAQAVTEPRCLGYLRLGGLAHARDPGSNFNRNTNRYQRRLKRRR